MLDGRPDSVMVIGAHPDDCEFGAGGVAFEWASQGTRVDFVIVTDGARGSAGCDSRPEDLVAIRRQEQHQSARVLGVSECRFLGFPDGEVENNEALLQEIVRVIRELRPQVVLTHTPEFLDHRRFRGGEGAWVNHRDHRAVGGATLDAVYPFARNPNSFLDLKLDCHTVQELYLWGSRFPNLEIPCREGIQAKARALACHRSQFSDDTDWSELAAGWGDTEAFERIELP
ncbi:MAG: PIG-L family deacetylase [Candidatus Eremiobacteraeota bacterium]|nr:PIG-L family deacetylase [Candidatus Eremiobacteraeota bacterium]